MLDLRKVFFFELSYYKTFLLSHNLDVIHIEKSICDGVLETMMNVDGKTKDSLNARLDFKEMGIRHSLHPREVNGKIVLPFACYPLSNDEKKDLC